MYDKRKKVAKSVEKYGAEIKKYEVVEVIPFQPDDKKVIASDLTMEEALKLVEENKHYMILPV